MDHYINIRRATPWTVTSWFTTASIGMLVFALYIIIAYGNPALHGHTEAWRKVQPIHFTPGDTVNNALLGGHLLFAVLVTVGGVMQMIPRLRTAAPRLHRWTGRVYAIAAIGVSLSGIYRIWAVGAAGDWTQHIGTTLNGLIILWFIYEAWRLALTRQFSEHRIWATRLFLVASGTWFFRIGLMAWLLIMRRPAGFDPETFSGPFLTTLAFAQFLVPLGVYETYRYVMRCGGQQAQRAISALIAALTLVTGAGVFGAAMVMWLPKMHM